MCINNYSKYTINYSIKSIYQQLYSSLINFSYPIIPILYKLYITNFKIIFFNQWL